MRVVREIEVGGRKIAVRELTVGEIRNWLKESGAVSGDVVDAALFDDFSLPDLTMMTSLDAEAINAMTPSEIREVRRVAEEVNADFFAMRSRVVALGRRVLSQT